MADTKITALTALTGADPANDVIPIVDVSDTTMAASGTTKKISVNNILGASGTATLASATITGDLTVDTSTLKVDSTNNRVGIGTASPGAIFDIYQATLGTAYFRGGYAARQMSITATSDGSNDGAIHTFSIGSSAGQFAFANSSGTRMTLDSSGNLGIGVTPSAKLDVQTSAGRFKVENFGASSVKLTSSGSFGFVATEHQFLLGATQAMTLDASGNLLVGTASVGGVFDTKFYLSSNSGTNKWAVGPYSTATNFAIIPTPGTGGVYLSGTSATSWTAYSDERLKDIIEPITNALTKVGSLRSVIGKFKGDEANTRRPFLIAQDLQSALPEAVDASNPDRLGVAYTDVIPLLVAAIKELTARVQTLETR